MPRRLRVERRIDLVLVSLCCLVMAGCMLIKRTEPEPPPKRVVFLGIENGTPAMEQAVEERVDPGYVRVPAEEYRETARRLNAEGMIDLDVARVAQEIGADVVIHGEYVRKNKRRGQLTVTMRTAAIGAVVGEYVVPVRRGVLPRRSARQLDKLRPELEALLGPPPAPPAEPASAVASAEADTEPAEVEEAGASDDSAKAPAVTQAAPAAQKGARTAAAPAPAAPKGARAEATPAAQKGARAEAAPAPAAQKGARGAKETGQAPRASAEPVKSQPEQAEAPPEPRAPAPVLVQDESGQVIDDETPPDLRAKKKKK